MIHSLLALTLGNVFSIFGGIATGAILCFAIILLTISIKLKPQPINLEKEENALSKQELECLIKEKQKLFLNRKALKLIGQFPHLKNLCIELAEDIAQKFKKRSKTPLYELSISEALSLFEITSLRLERVFEAPLLKPFRAVNVSLVLSALDFYKSSPVQNSVKAVKKAGAVMKIVRFFNILKPTTWIGFLKNALMNFVIKKYCLLAISIVGVEAYKIYSKNIFLDDENLVLDEFEKQSKLA